MKNFLKTLDIKYFLPFILSFLILFVIAAINLFDLIDFSNLSKVELESYPFGTEGSFWYCSEKAYFGTSALLMYVYLQALICGIVLYVSQREIWATVTCATAVFFKLYLILVFTPIIH